MAKQNAPTPLTQAEAQAQIQTLARSLKTLVRDDLSELIRQRNKVLRGLHELRDATLALIAACGPALDAETADLLDEYGRCLTETGHLILRNLGDNDVKPAQARRAGVVRASR